MASDVFYNRVPYTQRRAAPHDLLASSSSHASTSSLPTSVGTSRSAGTLTFPPLHLDPTYPADANPAANAPAFVLGSTFYHHPSLNALVSHHLVDASATTASAPQITLLNTNRDDDDSEADEHDAAASGVPRPKITSEFVSLNEDLVPASLDMQGDMLPADVHPSYPFGNLFGPLGGAIAADSAIVGGTHTVGSSLGDSTAGLDFGGGLEGFIRLGSSSHGRRSAVSNSGNAFINKASRSKLVGSSSTGAQDAQTAAAAKKLDLSPSLLFRTNTATVLAPPEWPFRRHGPGNTSYAALLRPSSNVFGSGPASQALAATLGGLPASAKILKEVWSDLALEELVPTDVGDTSAVRHLDPASPEADTVEGEKRGQKRARTDPETDAHFAKRIASIEADPLDLLGPVSREIRGQASQPWGTATRQQARESRPRRRRRAYSAQSDDSAVEAEHEPDIFAQRDLVRYSFALPPAKFGWTESPDDTEAEGEGTTHVKEDGIGWSTAKRVFVGEERDRLLPEVASRGTGAGVEAYKVSGWRANAGVLPRGAWRWGNGMAEEAGEESFVTEGEASTSRGTDRPPPQQEREVSDSEGGYADEGEWGQGAEDEELQRALLLQYQRERADGQAERASEGLDEDEDVVHEDEAQVEHDLDGQYTEEEDVVVDDDEDVESFGEDEDTA
ncbi:hypothetical protein PSEUBRA_000839 [Kalmanozyma brasiliensis GHG001]|uniref:Uncharacterized protein n=1 Tax=Kalmanozyma brasiliensis (strain GHG001) TaxID=1365824 RepID=V5EGF3_KALBG|nr:uncharacterized protein PSEUBRA_000839 [Kalmanozyma brasiliensis GHG001]EST09616.1 hypothetical protein PSEUBRA_000839 [Kalmanozyma brasiliensis GHG001]